MMLPKETKHYLRLVFNQIFNSVKPQQLISSQVKVLNNNLFINEDKYNLKNNCYVVGFGKAVYGMGYEIHNILKHHIRKAIYSIPEGFLERENFHKSVSHIHVFQGAKNNIPDNNSLNATQKILELVDNLKEEDLLLVLISGGGSALLVSPVAGITLEEKVEATKSLSRGGADISCLNAVRKRLSEVKGGKLAGRAYPATVLSLILSDVVGDPLDVIASGPTVYDNSSLPPLKQYQLSPSVLSALAEPKPFLDPKIFEQSHTYIIGNNSRALSAGKSFVDGDGRASCVLTSQLEGPVDRVALALAHFVTQTCYFLHKKITSSVYKSNVKECIKELHVSDNSLNDCISCLSTYNEEIFLFLGGETTVLVKGNGLGGRNMELALRFSLEMNKCLKENEDLQLFQIGVLCGGTDGIDGPTDAAGAIAYPQQEDMARRQGLDISEYIENNDSYHFFKAFNSGEDIIVTGHTGTNVMDAIIIYIKTQHKML